MSGPGYSEGFTYDGIGRLQTRTISSDATYVIAYAYNTIGVGEENRYLADFGTATVHEFMTSSLVAGFDYGASMQFGGALAPSSFSDFLRTENPAPLRGPMSISMTATVAKCSEHTARLQLGWKQ